MPNPKNPALASDSDDETTQSVRSTVVERYRKGSDSGSDVETSNSDQQTVVETYHSEVQEQIKKLKKDIGIAEKTLLAIKADLDKEHAKNKQTVQDTFFGALNLKQAKPQSAEIQILLDKKLELESNLNTKQEALARIESDKILSSVEREKALLEKEIELLTAKIARIKDIDNDLHVIEKTLSAKKKAIEPIKHEKEMLEKALKHIAPNITKKIAVIEEIQDFIDKASMRAEAAKPQGIIASLIYAIFRFFFGQRPYETALAEVVSKKKWQEQVIQSLRKDEADYILIDDEQKFFLASDNYKKLENEEKNITTLSKQREALIAEKGDKTPARLTIDIAERRVQLNRDSAAERKALITQCTLNEGFMKDEDEPGCKKVKSELKKFLTDPTLAALNRLNTAIEDSKIDRMVTVLLHKAQALYPEIATTPSAAQALIPIDPTSTVLILSEKIADNTATIDVLTLRQKALEQKKEALKQEAQKQEAWALEKKDIIIKNRTALYDLNTLLIMCQQLVPSDESENKGSLFLAQSLEKIIQKIKNNLPQAEIDALALEEMSGSFETIRTRHDNDENKIQALGNLLTILHGRIDQHNNLCTQAYTAIGEVLLAIPSTDIEKRDECEAIFHLVESLAEDASLEDTNRAFMEVKAYLCSLKQNEKDKSILAAIDVAIKKIDAIDPIEAIFTENRPWVLDADIKTHDNDTTEQDYHQCESYLETTLNELASIESLNESLKDERKQLDDQSIKHYHTDKLDDIIEQCTHKLITHNAIRIALKNYLNTPTQAHLTALENAMTKDLNYINNKKLLPLIEQAGAIRTEIDEIHQRLQDNNIPDSSHHL